MDASERWAEQEARWPAADVGASVARGPVTDLEAETTGAIVAFLTGIGLVVGPGTTTGAEAVPGIAIVDGGLALDPAVPGHHGDLLHEAGHLALLPPSQRARATGTLPDALGAGLELGAICWSVAAAHHLGLDLGDVFHPEGYRGDRAWLIETYGSGVFPGLPVLQWAGLAWAPGSEPDGEAPFPAMRRWLRTTEIAEDG